MFNRILNDVSTCTYVIRTNVHSSMPYRLRINIDKKYVCLGQLKPNGINTYFVEIWCYLFELFIEGNAIFHYNMYVAEIFKCIIIIFKHIVEIQIQDAGSINMALLSSSQTSALYYTEVIWKAFNIISKLVGNCWFLVI